MQYKQFLLDSFYDELADTLWLLEKDTVYADSYYSLLADINHNEVATEGALWSLADRVATLKSFYYKRTKSQSDWITPKKRRSNELTHDENNQLTDESITLLQAAIADKNSERALISDTGKTISFDEKWYRMINSCSFKSVAVDKLTDFISKFIEPDGWAKYFIGNIGKNNKRLIQEYHVMDKYNLNHGTSYAAMHLGGDTTKCVLVSVDTAEADGRGEPSGMTFLEIGAHTIIDRFIVGSFKHSSGRPITEAGPDELAELLEVN